MPPLADLHDQRFGKLIAVRRTTKTGSNGRVWHMWECVCDCGETITTRVSNLRNGRAKSCGCLQRESASKQVAAISKKDTTYACDMCGKKFIARKRRGKRYCSMECVRASELKPHPLTAICICCGKEFTPRRKGKLQTRCSARCASLDNSRRNNRRDAEMAIAEIATLLEGKADDTHP